MKEEVVIKKANPKDQKELIKLIQVADERTKEIASGKVKKFIDSDKGFFLLVTEGKKIVGYLLFGIGDPEAENQGIKVGDYSYVDWIAVDPKFRNKKIGSKLLEEAMRYSKKYSKKGISLTCRDGAFGFYKKNGFKKIKSYKKPNKKGKLTNCYMMMKKGENEKK
jgi:ribosomal protein S18 acetylase RimI-like enzyme